MQFVQFHATPEHPVVHPVRLRILLVEDNPAIRDALSRHLRRRGCDVETAAHGLEGLDRLASDDFDAVVSDIDMPRMNGLTFLRRALERYPSLRHRFLLCSAMPRESMDADPTIHFLPKPFSGSDLWAALTHLLATRSDQPSANGHGC